MSKKRIVTHSDGFHADDVFGVAALTLLLGKENIEVIRSRDQEIIDSGDYVLDTGYVYDADKNKFDHHQKGGAGSRDNGIPYAAFGLIWKKFGIEIAGSSKIADQIERDLVEPIDAFDNGVVLYQSTHPSGVQPLLLQYVLFAFEPARGESKDQDESFFEAVAFAQHLLKRKIIHAKAEDEAESIVRSSYETASDKRIILVEATPTVDRVPTTFVLIEYPEPLFFIRQHENANWQVVAIPVSKENFFTQRKPFPEAWGGLGNEELARVTGVPDSIFCHKGRFMAVAQSKEGALALARLALEA